MEYVKLGKTDLRISRVGFGCEPLGGVDWGRVDDKESISAVRRGLHLGITFFDTADVYGLGRSEEMLSRALGKQRHDVVIATKFGVNWRRNPKGGRANAFRDSSPQRVVEALEGSLRRLRIDCVPLYQIHWPDPSTPISRTMETLAKCQEAGKIRYIGCSNFPADLIREADGAYCLHSVQANYNVAERAIEGEISDCCKELGIAVLAYGCLAQGLLTGKYGPSTRFESNDRRSRLEKFQGKNFARFLVLVDKLRDIGVRYGKTPSQVAIRWILENPLIACAICGVKKAEQIEENVGALGWRLSQEDRDCLVDCLGRHAREARKPNGRSG